MSSDAPLLPRGFSLIELMIAVALLAVLLSIAAPSFVGYMDRARLRGAVDDTVSLIAAARTEAVKRSRNVTISLGGASAASWCIGANEAATPAAAAQFAASTACDCTSDSACFVDGSRRVLAGTEYGGVTAPVRTASVTVDGKQGTNVSLDTASFNLVSPRGTYQLQIQVSPLGQARACIPSGQPEMAGYPAC